MRGRCGRAQVGIEGIQTWASPATSDSQQVQAEAFIYRWDGSRFVHVGTQGPTRAWTRVGYGAVTFGHSVWSVGRGYYTISLRVKWFTASGALLGTKIIWPNATYDFTANRSWAGNPGFCQV